MLKRILIFLVCGIILIGCTSCDYETGEETYDTLFDAYPSVFVTENVTSVTFYGYFGSGWGRKVPSKYMPEILDWLDTFEIVREVNEDDMLPGVNSLWIKIEYEDGTIIKQSLDMVEINGITYLIQGGAYPPCYERILSGPGWL